MLFFPLISSLVLPNSSPPFKVSKTTPHLRASLPCLAFSCLPVAFLCFSRRGKRMGNKPTQIHGYWQGYAVLWSFQHVSGFVNSPREKKEEHACIVRWKDGDRSWSKPNTQQFNKI
ncbi:Uncharacterized protein TCM_013998 [Theobroma cacao]|uniref:Uncharacterized protein n=1 Tax=Theobroma cacao TaxID=3641 RepID=A0A061FWE7_THECC|nr:Uncharacterized protein TCM_013998 [Theobroma cacao]